MITESSRGTRTYEDFDLHLWREDGDEEHCYRVLGPTSGTVYGRMDNPDFAQVRLRERDFWDYPDRAEGGLVGALMERPSALDIGAIGPLGVALADLVLPDGAVRDLFLQAYEKVVRQSGNGLRVRLRIDPTEVARLPFEYVALERVESQGGFLALHPQISIVRSHDVRAPSYVARQSRSRVHFVGVFSATELGGRPLNTADDVEAVEAAIGGLRGSTSGAIEPRLFGASDDRADWDRVKAALARGADVVHFTGHGDFEDGSGSLVFETAEGGEAPVGATQFANMTKTSGARLAVLGACQSGRVGRDNAWSGIATALIRGAMPAVVANQFPVHQETARLVASEVYGGVLAHATADEAVSLARSFIAADQTLGADWGVPVLYLDNGDGVLFPADANDRLSGSLRRIAAADPAEIRVRSSNHSPFPGVRPYSREMAGSFYGRPERTQELLSMLRGEARFATLLGAAGTGKTSLIEAGIAARWDGPVVHITQYSDLAGAGQDAFAAAGLRARLDATLLELSREAAIDRLLLVFDQLERVFDLETEAHGEVEEALTALYVGRPDGVSILFSVREEAFVKTDAIRRRSGAPDVPVRISRLTRVEAAAALGGGLRSMLHGGVDDEVLDRVVAELDQLRSDESNSIEPTELQIVAQSIVKSMRDRADATQGPLELSIDHLEPSGEVIAAYLDNQLSTYFATDEEKARELLERFASARDGVWLAPEDLASDSASPALRITLERLVRSGFLVQRRRERSEFAISRPAVSRIVDRWVSDEAMQAKMGHQVLDGSMAEWRYQARTIPSETLRRLESVAALLEPRQDEALLLARSAVAANESTAPWFPHVRAKASETLTEIEQDGASNGLDSRLLGLDPDEGFESGALAANAASASTPIDRRMAALALAVTPDFADSLDQAVTDSGLSGWRRSARSAELWATVTDAGAHHPDRASLPHRTLVWLHRAWRRLVRDAYPIGRDSIRAGLIAGFLVGLVRAVVCLIECPAGGPGQEWATALGLNAAYTLLVVSATVAAVGAASAIAGLAPLRRPVVGVAVFGLMLWAVAWTNGLAISQWPLVVVLGFPAGLGVVLAAIRWRGLSILMLSLLGGVVWAGTHLVLTYTGGLTCDFPNCERSAALPIARSASFHGSQEVRWYDIATSTLDAGLVGATLAGGTAGAFALAPAGRLKSDEREDVQ